MKLDVPSQDHAAIRELATVRQWVLFKLKPKADHPGKFDKIPLQTNGRNASSTEPETWASFEECARAFAGGIGDGLGFVFTAEDDYVGIDADGVVDADGEISDDFVARLVAEAETYAELSLSRTGLHLIGKASLSGGSKGGGLEIYGDGRFFATTGWQIGQEDAIGWVDETAESVRKEITERKQKEWEEKRRQRGQKADGCGANGGHTESSRAKYGPNSRHDAIKFRAKALRQSGLIPDELRAALHAYNVARCEPPKDAHDVDRLAQWAIDRLSDADAPLDEDAATELGADEGDDSESRLQWLEHGSISEWFGDNGLSKPAPRRFIFDGILPAGIVGLLAGEGGCGKGRFALAMCIAGTTGRPFGPFQPAGEQPAGWWYIGKEDDRDEQHRRLWAAVNAFRGLPHDAAELLQQNLLIPPLRPGLKLGEDLATELGEFAAKRPPAVVLIDPLTRFWDETIQATVNSQEGASWCHNWLGEIQRTTGATVLAVHHVNQRGRQQTANDGGMNATQITGSMQLVDLARWVMQLAPISGERKRAMGLAESNLIEAQITKSNYSPQMTGWAFELTDTGAIVRLEMTGVQDRDTETVVGLVHEHAEEGIQKSKLERAAKDVGEMSRKRFRAAFNQAVDSGEIEFRGDRKMKGEYRLYPVESRPGSTAGTES